MEHDHSHRCICEHEHVRYCRSCRTVYCCACRQEWVTRPLTWQYGPYLQYQHYSVGALQYSGVGQSISKVVEITCAHQAEG